MGPLDWPGRLARLGLARPQDVPGVQGNLRPAGVWGGAPHLPIFLSPVLFFVLVFAGRDWVCLTGALPGGAGVCYNGCMVTILDYGAGNLTSVRLAFERLGETPTVISRAEEWRGGRIVFPGVGSAASGMKNLRERGFDKLLLRAAKEEKVPILGICLGMQLLLDGSEEDGGVEGLGLIPGRCVRFDPARDPSAKIPHMGWNTVTESQFQYLDNDRTNRKTIPHPLFWGIPDNSAFYFVHSYYVRPDAEGIVAGWTDYCGIRFASAIGGLYNADGPLFATQFHPERSGEAGARLLRNFLSWEGGQCC